MLARRFLALSGAVALFLAPGAAHAAAPAGTAPAYTAPSYTASPDPTRVMFVGDSLTGSPGCWRSDVWTELTDAAHLVDMVGIRTENECGDVTNAAGEAWDPDNTGIGGITTTRMWVKLATDDVLAATDPEIIVMLLGTNDLLGGATADHVIGEYDKLLALYREHDATMSIVVGTPPPMTDAACGCDAQQQALAAALPQWAESASTSDSPVTVADLSSTIDPDADTYDGIHMTEAGDAKLAAAWTPAISAALDARVLTAEAPEGDGAVAGVDTAATEDPEPQPTTRSWIVLALVVAVAGAVTFAMTRSRRSQP